jgi:transposase
MLAQSYPNYKRRIDALRHGSGTRFCVACCIANELRVRGGLDEEECFIDATFIMAKGGSAEIGPTKRGKGMKIVAIVDRHGSPLSVSTHAANHHEVRLVQLCLDFYMIEVKPQNLIGDRAYDSDPLDEELRGDGIEMIAPHRSNRTKPPTQDRRRLSRCMRRWLVERFFAWIQWRAASSSVGSTTSITSSASPSLPALSSSSDDFEIGSRSFVGWRASCLPSGLCSRRLARRYRQDRLRWVALIVGTPVRGYKVICHKLPVGAHKHAHMQHP